MTPQRFSPFLLAILLPLLIGCGGSSGDASDAISNNTNLSSTDSIREDGTESNLSADLVGDIPAGDITQYGAISVGDENGAVSDLVGAFFSLENGISMEFMETVFSSNKTLCSVDDDDTLDFEEFSVGFVPSFNNIGKQAISAGESITLTSDQGTFSELQDQSAGPYLFYTLPDMQSLPDSAVPRTIQVDIPGAAFPAYQSVEMPSVSPLSRVDFGSSNTITATSTFTWTADDQPGSMIRIFSSTAGGFFLEDGMTITCLTPDTGTFEFPPSIQAMLGPDFTGSTPIFSRLAIRSEFAEQSVLFLIRESFAN